jgi:hypothetical protein
MADGGTAAIASHIHAELAENGMCRPIDLDERYQRRTNPDKATSYPYSTLCSLTGFNRGNQFARLPVYAIYSAVAAPSPAAIPAPDSRRPRWLAPSIGMSVTELSAIRMRKSVSPLAVPAHWI